MIKKVPITFEGSVKMQQELERLKNHERPAVVKAIAEAREHGDLSENAEYHAARERQSFIEGRILELEDMVTRLEVIDTSKFTGEDTVKFGATILVADQETDEEHRYRIVGSYESDVKTGHLSITSPLARALIGKRIGDSVEVTTPKGTKMYDIVEVQYC